MEAEGFIILGILFYGALASLNKIPYVVESGKIDLDDMLLSWFLYSSQSVSLGVVIYGTVLIALAK